MKYLFDNQASKHVKLTICQILATCCYNVLFIPEVIFYTLDQYVCVHANTAYILMYS